MPGVLELRNVSKHFPGHAAASEVSLEVPKGELFSLLGPSGCGKTTTLRLIAGFERPTAGEIFLSGQAIHPLPPYRRNVSTVFQPNSGSSTVCRLRQALAIESTKTGGYEA